MICRASERVGVTFPTYFIATQIKRSWVVYVEGQQRLRDRAPRRSRQKHTQAQRQSLANHSRHMRHLYRLLQHFIHSNKHL